MFLSISIFVGPSFASSEYIVNIENDSYNLGCEQDNSCFTPYIIKIDIGDKVTWENTDSAIHVIKNLDDSIESINYIESGLIKSGNSFTKSFVDEGVFLYFCPLHPWMDGIVVVGNVEYTGEKFEKEIPLPIVLDENYVVEEYVENLFVPVNMEFVGNDLLVIEAHIYSLIFHLSTFYSIKLIVFLVTLWGNIH